MQKGLSVNIFRSEYNCVLNKLHDKKTACILGIDAPFAPSKDYPALKLIKRNLFGKEYLHLEPAEVEPGEWFSFGGSFAYCSDSRFCEVSKYPLPIHDRRMNLENNNNY